MEVYGVVYLIIDGTNDKEYVGQTTRSVEIRFKEHANYNDSYINHAIRAHGEDMFATAILKVCMNKEELDFWERYFIRSRNTIYPNGYNLTDGGEGGIPCEEVRKRMSVARKGHEVSDETRAKLSEARRGERNPRYGKKNTPEHQAKIVASNLGKKRTPETCKNISEALKGKPFTVERCANISAAKRKESLYPNLMTELVEYNLSYAALGKLLNLASSIVSRKMRGQKNFTARDKEKLEEIFGKPAEYLLERDD